MGGYTLGDILFIVLIFGVIYGCVWLSRRGKG